MVFILAGHIKKPLVPLQSIFDIGFEVWKASSNLFKTFQRCCLHKLKNCFLICSCIVFRDNPYYE